MSHETVPVYHQRCTWRPRTPCRPAGLLVKLAKQYTSTITLEKNGKTCDMRKLMAVMGMGIRQGETITVTAEGEDEAAAIEAVEKFLTENV